MNRYDKDAEKIYNGLQTLIQEKIHDLPEVRYIHAEANFRSIFLVFFRK